MEARRYAITSTLLSGVSQKDSCSQIHADESIYKKLFDHLLEGIGIIDPKGSVLFANRELATILGYGHDEILNENISSMVRPSQKTKFEMIQERCLSGHLSMSEFELLRKDKNPVSTIISFTLFNAEPGKEASMMMSVLDITKHKSIEEIIIKTEKKYRSIFENSVDGIFQTDDQDKLISANPAMAHIFGYKSPREFISAINSRKQKIYSDSKCYRKLKSLLKRQDSVHNFEFRALQRNGREIWINENVRSIRDDQGNLLYYEGTLQDITEKKNLESELFQSKKMEAIGRIAGGIAHDFNNILTAIMGNAAMGERCLDPKSQAAARIKAIREAADRAGQLTRQLLTISRKQRVNPVFVNVNTAVLNVGKILERILGEDIELKILLDENLKSIYADPSQIEQVILNLSINSRDAMHQGGTLSISTDNVDLDSAFCRNHPDGVPGEYVRLSVSDTGTGIPKESLGYIFEPFYTTKKTGTGFGLSIVYSVIKRYAGHIEIDTAVQSGTKFSIYIPAVSGKAEITHASSVIDRTAALSEKTILIVEDEESIREILTDILQEMGCRTFSASTAEEALTQFKNFGQPIDLLITDVILPGRRGPEMAEEFEKVYPDMKVLFMSGYPVDKFHQGDLFLGQTSFIAKPFTPDMILDKLRHIFPQQ
ncbi:PAS domain S-box-containing protein [Syntrophus gentianae]|uniref:histidine kinase n=1 Tax=Syntrophus gentianae TaxID=43775 RepID=A0A1H7WV78_9BACT|nr:PAS domain-containing sensor histidine kinase [Syntrophus gentianae]SEM25480.1 PAS domain S-box-containing protein [Syntrophus gentianae]